MSNDGVLVSRKWLERVNYKLFGNKDIDDNGQATGGVFYDVRPARLQTAWTQSNGVWTATACFIVNDTADTSFTFPVYAPTATEDPGGTAQTTRFFVVWRERWEMIAAAGKKYSLSKTTVGVPKSFTSKVLVGFTGTDNPSVITSISVNNQTGALNFNTQYIHSEFSVESTETVLKNVTLS